jgi:hypothetical protein
MPFLAKEIPADKREGSKSGRPCWILHGSARLDEARCGVRRAAGALPNAPTFTTPMGWFLLNQDADAALKEFRQRVGNLTVASTVDGATGVEYMKRDELETALPFAEKAVQLAPNMFPARNVFGRILLDLGQVERAIKELEEGARLAPSSPEMHFALARAYTRAGRKADAARERELFKRLQDEFEAKRVRRAAGQTDGQPTQAKAVTSLILWIEYRVDPGMKVEMANLCFSKNALSCAVMVAYLAIFGVGSWASSIVSSQTSALSAGDQERIPVGAELVGDGVALSAMRRKTASHHKTGMSRAIEGIAESKVLTANPLMTFRIGNYGYEIKRRTSKAFTLSPTGRRQSQLPILYAFGEGKRAKHYIFATKARSMKVW